MHFSHLVKVRKNSHSLSLQAFLTHSHSLSLSLAGLRSLERIVALLPRSSSVCLSRTGVHRDHTLHVSAHLSLWVVQCSGHPYTKTCPPSGAYSQPSFSSSTWKRWDMDVQTIGVISQEWLKIEFKLLLSANKKSYTPRRLAQQRMTLNDRFCIARYLCGS